MAKKSEITKMQDKTYLAKDFSSFRSDLTRYAKNYFADANADFSEASLGGMFVELAAYVGDSMSFFLDHQYNELRPDTAVEQKSILAHARNAGVKIRGASPASTELSWFIEVPATVNTTLGLYEPAKINLPILLEGTSADTGGGVRFTTTEECDFNERGPNNEFLAKITVSSLDSGGNPSSYILEKKVPAVSGEINSETFSIGKSTSFKKIQLSQINISEIISVKDGDGNSYYEVDFLTQNTAFKKTKNLSMDMLEVPSVLEIVSAARRFVTETDFNSGITTLTFGGGDESLSDNDSVPDPSELALPLYGRPAFSRFAIDPNKLLKTQTLGVAPANTILTIRYRAGGGISHNVGIGDINTVSGVNIAFPGGPSAVESTSAVASLDVTNYNPATGGLGRPTIDDIRSAIASSRNQQARIVTQDDLLARVYSLPLPFGRVFRASIRKSSRNPLASELYVISKNSSNQLAMSSDTLKKNLSLYLNEFRLISDAIDVLDATVVNYGIEFAIVVTPASNKSSVLSLVESSLTSVTNLNKYQIDQPLIEADFINAIINTPGVMSLTNFKIFNISGVHGSRYYSPFTYNLTTQKARGMIVPPAGGIFEMKYTSDDIFGSAE